MTIYDNIKQTYLIARKSHDSVSRSILSTLIGDIETAAKKGSVIDDTFIIAICKKYINNINETEKAAGVTDISTREKNIIQYFIPVQLDETKLREVIGELNPATMGDGMAFLKANYPGLYDGKLASAVIKEVINDNYGKS